MFFLGRVRFSSGRRVGGVLGFKGECGRGFVRILHSGVYLIHFI